VEITRSRVTRGRSDRRFGHKGLVIPKVSGAWYDVTVQADGRIVTAGQLLADLAVARYLPNGRADGSFGAGSVASVKVDPSGFLRGQAMEVTIHADGTILAVGAHRALSASYRSLSRVMGRSRTRMPVAWWVALAAMW
jgi:hypothetical protein